MWYGILFNNSLIEISILKEATMQNNDLKNELKHLRSRLHELEKCEKKRPEMDNKYKRLVEGAPIISYIYGIKSGAIFWSNRIQSLLGFSPDALHKNPFAWINAIHPDDQAKVKALLTSLPTITSFSIEYRVKDNHGKWHWFNDSSISVKKTDKEYIIEGIAIDITKQKLTENELKISEEKYRLIVERANDGIEITQNDKIIYTNNRFAEILGYKLDELKNISFSKIFSKQGKLDLKQRQHKRENGELLPNYYETTFVGKNGELIDVDVNYQIIDFHGKPATFAIIRDITERKKTEEALRQSEKKYRDLFEKSEDAILIIHNGKFTDCNQAAVKMLRYNNKNEFLNTHPSELSPEKQADGKSSLTKANEIMKMALENGSCRFEWNHKRSNGEVFPVEVLLTAVSIDEKDQILHTVWRDITERKKAEENIRAALEKAEESDRLKSAFLANMSHEIRTPMNGIMGFARLLRKKDLSGEKQEKYLDVIEKSSERMLNIINDLIDISKIESGQMELHSQNMNLNEVIAFIQSFFEPECASKGLELISSFTLPNDHAIIISDRDKLEAILINLLKNAIKFTHHGKINFGYEQNGDKLVFFVDDTGIGIPENKQKQIFDRFVQADSSMTKPYEGAGLGLSISKAFVEMLGGNLELRSKVNSGSRFYFSIPYVTPVEKSDQGINLKENENNTSLKLSKHDLKIIIAEDDEPSFLYLNILMQAFCKTIIHARNGAECVELCKTHKDVDLILMDVKMPLMGGYEATKSIRTFNQNVVIVAQTAYAFKDDQNKIIESGCNDYITKPIQEDDLRKLIDKYFSK